MRWAKRSSSEATGNDPQQLWGELIGVDDRTDHERTFTVYTRSGSLRVVDDKGNERLVGPDNGLNKYDILREVMVQFQVHALRVKPTPDAKPPIA
ncbi:MAG TPA: hypothetical protein VHS80_13745 [Chthoniobacterales bacterium]|nr:hypothetical protein [Chthoniobacterales bacterium]